MSSLCRHPNGYTHQRFRLHNIRVLTELTERINLREERAKRHVGLRYTWLRITLQWQKHELTARYISGNQEAKRAQVRTLRAVTQKSHPPATHLYVISSDGDQAFNTWALRNISNLTNHFKFITTPSVKHLFSLPRRPLGSFSSSFHALGWSPWLFHWETKAIRTVSLHLLTSVLSCYLRHIHDPLKPKVTFCLWHPSFSFYKNHSWPCFFYPYHTRVCVYVWWGWCGVGVWVWEVSVCVCVLRIKLRVLYMLSKHSTTKLHTQSFVFGPEPHCEAQVSTDLLILLSQRLPQRC